MSDTPQDLRSELERVTVERDKARALLRSLVRFEQGNGHRHEVPCVWDRDNSPGVRGEPCAKCIAFREARRLLGLGDEQLPQGPRVEAKP